MKKWLIKRSVMIAYRLCEALAALGLLALAYRFLGALGVLIGSVVLWKIGKEVDEYM